MLFKFIGDRFSMLVHVVYALRCRIVVLQHRGKFANPATASNIHEVIDFIRFLEKPDNPAPYTVFG